MAGSDREFTVTPAKGELVPAGKPGTLLNVSFTPKKYGKVYVGRLSVHVSHMVPSFSTLRYM